MRTGAPVFVLATLLCAVTAGCEAVGAVDDNLENGGSGSGEVTFVNQTDRPFAVIAFEEELSHRIDPLPALPNDEFEEQQIEVNASDSPEKISGYEKGDGLFVLLYAKCGDDCTISEQVVENWGRDAAPTVGSFRLSAEDLKNRNYQIRVNELERVK